MEEIIYTSLFCVFICIISFQIGVWIQKRTQIALFNPLLIAIILVIAWVHILDIPIAVFKQKTEVIGMLLGPATVVLALPMYRQRRLLRENIVPILVSTGIGALTSVLSILLLSMLFGYESLITYSLVPKSVTTAIAMEITNQLGGIVGVTVTAVVITGITGAVIAPNMIKLFKIKHEIAVGLAIGTASHAVGTSKAIQLGEVQGAMSGLAIGIVGIFTVILSLFI